MTYTTNDGEERKEVPRREAGDSFDPQRVSGTMEDGPGISGQAGPENEVRAGSNVRRLDQEERGPIGRPCAIYVLLDENQEIFYVGRTMHPRERLGVHKGNFGSNITMQVVQSTFVDEDPGQAERKWIAHYAAIGCKLANRQDPTDWIPPRILPKEDLIRLRIDSEDKARLEELAREEGLSLSSWIRMQLLRMVREGRPARKKKAK